MKNYITLFASILAAVVLSSCNRDPDPVLTISGTKNYVCGPDGGSGNVNINTTYPWNASCAASWVTLSTKSGEAGNSPLEFTIASSDDPEERNAFICITTQNLRDTIKINQSQRDKIVVSGQKEYTIPQEGGDFDIELKTNVSFKVSTTANWVTNTATKSYSDRTVTFNVKPNDSYDSREAWIIFNGGGITDSIKVVQSQKDAMLIPDENSIILSRKADIFTINMSTNVNYSVSLSNGGWLRRIETKALRDESIVFEVSENKTGASRTATITISGPSKLKKVFTVMQSAGNLLYINVDATAFKAPELKGQQLSGTISWGDGTIEKYNTDLLHSYSDKNVRTISVEMVGNTSMKLNSLVGVESIDLSDF